MTQQSASSPPSPRPLIRSGVQANPELLTAACCIAVADAAITEGEMKLLRALAAKVGVGDMSLNATLERAKRDPTFYESQFRLGIGDARATIRTLLVIAAADGKISSKERSLLDFFAARLGLSKTDVDELLSGLIGKVRARRRLRGESPD
jgi:tellurite resistance protein